VEKLGDPVEKVWVTQWKRLGDPRVDMAEVKCLQQNGVKKGGGGQDCRHRRDRNEIARDWTRTLPMIAVMHGFPLNKAEPGGW